jgi:hypothetical protein
MLSHLASSTFWKAARIPFRPQSGVSWTDKVEGIEAGRWIDEIDESVGRLFSGMVIWKGPIFARCSPIIPTKPGVTGKPSCWLASHFFHIKEAELSRG